jgi:predicted GNAT family acetyltransferase
MTPDQLRALYDDDQRIHDTYPDARREAFPHLVRHVNLEGGDGFIIYSRLTAENADAVIREQIDYFTALGQDFEWKLYSHDTPADLQDRLAAHGFEIEEDEAIMVLDLKNLPEILRQPVSHDIRRITDPDLIASDVMVVQSQVWNEDYSEFAKAMAKTLRETPDQISFYAAYVNDTPVSSAWIYFTSGSRFASLWGGSTLAQHRGRGLYTALLAVRAQDAIQRGREFLTVDASDMSRPILEKLGFVQIATSWPCKWHVKRA